VASTSRSTKMPKVIVDVIKALKDQPILLIVMVVNLSIIAALVYMLREVSAAAKQDRDTRNLILQECMKQRN
jgi:hypothetical protein